MYEAHHGLSQRPFGETTTASAYVPLPSRDAALRRVRYGLEHGLGPAVLYGGCGTGKTLAVNRLAADLGAPTVHLTFPILTAPDLVAYLAEEFDGEPSARLPLNTALRRLRVTLARLTADGVRPLLIVDEAQLILDPAVLECLRLLLNFQTDGTPDLSLLLVGTGELLLQLPAALQERLTARSLLPPLTEAETIAYIDGRLASAGAREPLFEPEALTALHRESMGVPRRLNHIADLALLIAYAEERPRVDVRIVALAAREFRIDLDPLAA